MKDVIKHIASVIAVIIACIVVLKSGCPFTASQSSTLRVPADTNYAPVREHEYRPPSTPFERATPTPAPLPSNVKPRDTKRQVIIVKRIPVRGLDTVIVDTTVITIATDDSLYVRKQPGIETTVDEYRFVPPIFSFDLFVSVGVSCAPGDGLRMRPSAAVSPVEIVGALRIPLEVDTDGFGLGIGGRFRSWMMIASSHWAFKDCSRSIRISLHYAF